ncbi:MAG: glycoside hydrolase family 32 protein [Clostridiales bacterium]|jgi:beta-fructofuranosidase|nr:glycoside hydrolase family 32 protein [Clostridiales bacterium]
MKNGNLRLKYHFEPKKGWINDPNGLIFFGGKYHAFFQYNPYAAKWGKMHWGHAVSGDLLNWEELPAALYPDAPYENSGGCFSGSAVCGGDGMLYLFYTSVGKETGQTVSMAFSRDGTRFEKYAGNPIISKNPQGFKNFRDPKVAKIDGIYRMVIGAGDKTCGKVLLFESADLLNWKYAGVLFGGGEFKDCIECPDLFKLGDKYVLMFSKIGEKLKSVYFVVGNLKDGALTDYSVCNPENGIDFYAPQTFARGDKRIMIGWMYHWGKRPPFGCKFAGALSIPRELTLNDGKIYNFPVDSARRLLKPQSEYVSFHGNEIEFSDHKNKKTAFVMPVEPKRVDILEDTKTVEVFLNGGECSYTFWLR